MLIFWGETCLFYFNIFLFHDLTNTPYGYIIIPTGGIFMDEKDIINENVNIPDEMGENETECACGRKKLRSEE